MSDQDKVNRRDFIVTTASIAGAATTGAASALAQTKPPEGFDAQNPLAENWQKRLSEIVELDLNKQTFEKDTRELQQEAVKERHRIYCHLLMKLISRFWNGNKRGPLGSYPLRAAQIEPIQSNGPSQPTQRYSGDVIKDPDPRFQRVSWDRYLGHNIACIAVDGNGEIIDFDFNHNDFFRSSAEHAESRMVRRLFSLTDIFDSWKTGGVPGKPRAASLTKVTLYTSLESCAQCSGVMSLAGVKQVVYLQNDFTAYKIGNIMYNLANRIPNKDSLGNIVSDRPGAPIPIPASMIGLDEFDALNQANITFVKDLKAAEASKDSSKAFFVSSDKTFVDYEPSITSFLCTDTARGIFERGGNKLNEQSLTFPNSRFPDEKDVLTNEQCLAEAREFFKYVDVEGYRGSPHKL
jgi:tRNA(Arg) A34 adenosine deaminase TadA